MSQAAKEATARWNFTTFTLIRWQSIHTIHVGTFHYMDMFFFKWAKRKNEIIEKTEKLRLFEKYFTFPLKTYRVHGFCTIGQYGTSEI